MTTDLNSLFSKDRPGKGLQAMVSLPFAFQVSYALILALTMALLVISKPAFANEFCNTYLNQLPSEAQISDTLNDLIEEEVLSQLDVNQVLNLLRNPEHTELVARHLTYARALKELNIEELTEKQWHILLIAHAYGFDPDNLDPRGEYTIHQNGKKMQILQYRNLFTNDQAKILMVSGVAGLWDRFLAAGDALRGNTVVETRRGRADVVDERGRPVKSVWTGRPKRVYIDGGHKGREQRKDRRIVPKD